MMIVMQLLTIDKVPRVFGGATKLVFGGGKVQLESKVAAVAVGMKRLKKWLPPNMDTNNIAVTDRGVWQPEEMFLHYWGSSTQYNIEKY
jgi:hypothetical protein